MARRPRKRRPYLVVLPYVVIVVVLVIIDLVLPHVDPSLDIPFTREKQEDGIAYLEINRGYLAPFFPAGSPLIPELKSSYVRKVKSPGALRVLCLGESSMFGVPFQLAATVPALVRKQLRHLYPDVEIEVLNLGASAINTNVIRALVPEFLSLEPDLVLVYTGHNEFYGPDGIGASWIERQVPGLTAWKYRARRRPLVHAFQRFVSEMSKTPSNGDRNLMRQVSGGAEVALNSPGSERIFSRFRENLSDIVHGFRERGVPVIIADISSNLMFPPFAPASTVRPDPLVQAVAAGRFGEADSIIRRGLAGDPSNAYFLYWRGRAALAAGDTLRSVRDLEQARDHDLLKFRAPGRVNAIIHEVGATAAVPVLPIDSLLRVRSPHNITDSTFFSEHLHPTFAGYDLIARTFVQAIVDQHLPILPFRPKASLLPFHADSLGVPWLDLGYGALGMRALTSRWPFTDMPARHDELEHREPWELKIVRDVYAGNLGWRDALLHYAYEAHRHDRQEAMVTALTAVVEEDPWSYAFRYGLAGALESVGRIPEAIQEYRRALRLKPDFYQGKVDLADLLIREGRTDEGYDELEAFFDAPSSATAPAAIRVKAFFGLAKVAASQDSIEASLGLLDETLRLAPGHPQALDLRAKLLRKRR